MPLYFRPKAILAIVLFAIICSWSHAHNGAIAFAYPMETISVDADLSDWPADLQKYPISFYQFGFKPDSPDDIRGHFMIGYNQELQEIYIGVEMRDDSYIRNRENPEYWAHDMQVLYIDPQHKTQSTGVFALEVNEYFRKIVDQELNWDPFVLQASWEMVEVKAQRYDERTVYEWKLKLDGYIHEGRTLGFDYVVFDKDSTDGDTNTVGWGRDEGVKHECSTCLGDVLLRPSKDKLVSVEGNVHTDTEGILPNTIRMRLQEKPENFVDILIDSTGSYQSRIPYGNYLLEITGGLVEVEDEFYRIEAKNSAILTAGYNQPVRTEGQLEVIVLPRPELIPEKGLLHEYNSTESAELKNIIDAYMQYYGIPGVSLALIKDGTLFYHNTYGYKNNSTKEPVDEKTLFEAASISKPVFAYTVLRLAERGTIDLDKPLAEYLPFEDLNAYPEYKKMTGRHVLTHRSGLPNWGRTMKFSPGEKYGYSGEGFEYLKRVVMHITGQEADVIVDQEVKEPMNIRHMQFRETPGLKKQVATGHMNGSPTVRFLPQKPGMAWSMYTEASEFSKFALSLLHRNGLKPTTFSAMMEIQTPYPEDMIKDPTQEEGMGLGIALRHTDQGRVFGHGGNNGDFKCMFEIYEDLGMGYIIFTNSDTGEELSDDLAQILIEGRKQAEKADSGTHE